MLNKCPECKLPISDKAIACPHCGYPLRPYPPRPKRPKNKAHMRLPNGFGQISEIKNKPLRNPWRAMVTVGKTSTGRPICKILKPQGYFSSYNEAYAALVEYNKNPYDLDDDMRVKELYERWSKEYFKTLANDSSIRTITAAWAYCSSVYDMRVKDLRARHIKYCMEKGEANIKGELRSPSNSMKARIKSLFNLMLDYALEYELVDRNYARTFDVGSDIIENINEMKRGHIAFTDEEMHKLWDNVDKIPYVNIILLQCYTGLRPQELGLLERLNINLEKWTMTGGMKTEAGRNRVIPIHPRIREIVKNLYDESEKYNSKYLINANDGKTHKDSYLMTYDKYHLRFKNVIKVLDMNPLHRAHDPRKQFITMAKAAGVDEYAIKQIVGHKISDITEAVYTEREQDWLHKEIEKIK